MQGNGVVYLTVFVPFGALLRFGLVLRELWEDQRLLRNCMWSGSKSTGKLGRLLNDAMPL